MLAAPASETIAPTDHDAQLARDSSAALAPLLRDDLNSLPHILLRTKDNNEADIALPPSILRLLLGALQEMAKGNAVTLLPRQSELTTQQAADLMRISRPSLIKILDNGKLHYRKIGAHRRILYSDAIRYIESEHSRRVSVMEELVAETEQLDLYR